MSEKRKYSTIEEPADNIIDLWEILNADKRNKKYFYRGQVQEYPGPLLPSMYRPFFSEKDTPIDTFHPLAKYSIKKCGNLFYGDHNYEISKSVAALFENCPSNQVKEIKTIFDKVLKSSDIAQLQVEKRLNRQLTSWFEIIEETLNDSEKSIYTQYIREWDPIIKRYHKRCLRMFFFQFIFGYMYGNLLSQQYGLNSAYLDATTDLDVAIFFATHDCIRACLKIFNHHSNGGQHYPGLAGIHIRFKIPAEATVPG